MAANHLREPASALLPQPLPHAGLKRHADDELETQSNISTHFKKLRINHAPRYHSLHQASVPNPAPASASAAVTQPISSWYPSTITDDHTSTSPTLQANDFMSVDETSHRIIIHDLDAEIATIEAEEQTPNTFFLTDIDKKVSAIPHSVLQPVSRDKADPNTQLILYRDPVSISVPEGEDAVRKAIVEARRRTRERQAIERQQARVEIKPAKSPVRTLPDVRTWTNGYNDSHRNEYGLASSSHAPSHFYAEEDGDDPDAMDMDEEL